MLSYSWSVGAVLAAGLCLACSGGGSGSTEAPSQSAQPTNSLPMPTPSGAGTPARPVTSGGVPAAAPSSDDPTRPAAPSGGGSGATASNPPDAGQPAEADASVPSVSASTLVTFHNGGFWSDDSGKRIEAHGGGFLRVEDTYYWFGEDKSGNSAGFKAVNCYASKDLSHWQLRGAAITPKTAPELTASDRIIERPKVIYNASTQRYVMWLHWEGKNYAEAKAGVFSSATVEGPYTYHSAFRPNNNMSRDDTLFRDDDGKAYFLSAANENADLVLYELSADYLTVARQVATLFAGNKREAPALFKDRGRYYLITSGATGWDPNQAKYTTASAIGGPWSPLQNLGDGTTFDTQSTYVIPVQGSERTTYVYAGDRWQDPDLASSKYIWLPLELSDDGKLSLNYYADWQLDLRTGQWSADDGFLPQRDWKLLRVDSEETAAENGRGARAFDGAANTFWHTQYTDAAPTPPHELQIDLGARHLLNALRYLPRQDGNDHGVVADYELYVSDDPDQWNTPASAGKLEANFQPKLVPFPARSGRYVRFVAKSEINGKQWTSVAELDLQGTRL